MASNDDRMRIPIGVRASHAKILRAVLRDPSGGEVAPLIARARVSTLESLPEAVDFHRMIGPAHAALREHVPDEVALALDRLYREERARHLLVTGTLRHVTTSMLEQTIPFLVVKGPALASAVYQEPRLRFYRDLDLLVPRRSFPSALRMLEANGGQVIDPNWSYLDEHLAGELELTTGIDLHWHFLFSEHLRRRLDIRMGEVFERARDVDVGGATVRTLDAADTLIHLALHACKEGGQRLIWLKDVEQSVLNDRPDWDVVIARAREWRVGIFVGTILLRASRLLRFSVPAEVTRALVPARTWRLTLAGVDRAFPVDVWAGHETPATFAAEAAQESAPATMANILRRAAASVGSAVRRGGDHDSPEPDPERREAFLRKVESGT